MSTRSFPKFVKRLDEIGLRDEVEAHAHSYFVTLRDLYEGPVGAPSISNARQFVYRWLMKRKGKGLNEVARLFDRAPSGVSKLTRGSK